MHLIHASILQDLEIRKVETYNNLNILNFTFISFNVEISIEFLSRTHFGCRDVIKSAIFCIIWSRGSNLTEA